MNSGPNEQNERGIAHIVSFGLAAAGLATIIQLSTLAKLDHSLLVTVYGFAVAIPMLVTSGLAVHPATEVNLANQISKEALFFLHFFGVLASVVAIGGLFFHFSLFVGAAYLVGVAACTVAARKMATID